MTPPTWKQPPIIKVYEALGAVADGRIEVEGNTAKVTSSSGNKFYNVAYDPEANAIMTNDNGSYWKGYLGYPAIAYLLTVGVLPYDKKLSELLKGIPWKDINQEFKNDFEKTLTHIESVMDPEHARDLAVHAHDIAFSLSQLNLMKLGPQTKPPLGY